MVKFATFLPNSKDVPYLMGKLPDFSRPSSQNPKTAAISDKVLEAIRAVQVIKKHHGNHFRKKII